MQGVQLQALSILFTLWANVTLTGLALFAVVGRSAHAGLRCWIRAMLLQSLGWAALIVAPLAGVGRPWVSSAGVWALSLSFALGWRALGLYLERPVGWRWIVLWPLGLAMLNGLIYEHVQWRVSLVNVLLAVQLAAVVHLALRPAPQGRAWRWLLAGAASASAAMLLARAALMAGWPEDYPSFGANHPLSIAGLIIDNATVSLATLAFLLAHRDEAERRLRQLATYDDLSGVLNRRAVLEQAQRLVRLAHRHEVPVTVMMIDIDHFKRINDERGHPAGDQVIAGFAAVLQESLREGDVVGRYGGEEFMAVLYDADAAAAQRVDARLRQRLRLRPWPTPDGSVDFSAGAFTMNRADGDLDAAIARADAALYQAKATGRGRLVWVAGA